MWDKAEEPITSWKLTVLAVFMSVIQILIPVLIILAGIYWEEVIELIKTVKGYL